MDKVQKSSNSECYTSSSEPFRYNFLGLRINVKIKASFGKIVRRADNATPLYPQKLPLNFAKKWRSLSRYSSLAD
jgi:hypothetical protein